MVPASKAQIDHIEMKRKAIKPRKNLELNKTKQSYEEKIKSVKQ